MKADYLEGVPANYIKENIEGSEQNWTEIQKIFDDLVQLNLIQKKPDGTGRFKYKITDKGRMSWQKWKEVFDQMKGVFV